MANADVSAKLSPGLRRGAAPGSEAMSGPILRVLRIWSVIIRLGLIQTALGAIIVLTTSTLNRVMIVELGMLAMVPGLLVGWHYAIQMLRPRWGYGSDVGGQRTPWIIGGMAVLATGGVAAAASVALASVDPLLGLVASVIAFTLIGIGVGASGTALLTLLATIIPPAWRAIAASTVWIMMIAGFVVTTITAGTLLEPFSFERLVTVSAQVSALAFCVSVIAVWGIEAAARDRPLGQNNVPDTTLGSNQARLPEAEPSTAGPIARAKPDFKTALRDVWQETEARRFTIFVFVSMLAYSMQDLILEPFAGIVFGMTPGESTKLSGTQHAGVLAGMIGVAALSSLFGGSRVGALRWWAIVGCIASALMLAGLVVAAFWGPGWPLQANVFALGASTGAFAVAAIGSMMGLASSGTAKREGTRMGLWGAAQAIAFGIGGLLGAVLVDLSGALLGSPIVAYATVFALEAALFVASAMLAVGVGRTTADDNRIAAPLGGETLMELEAR